MTVIESLRADKKPSLFKITESYNVVTFLADNLLRPTLQSEMTNLWLV